MVFRLRTQHHRRSRPSRSSRPSLEDLEIRLAPAGASSPVGYIPSEIRAAYGINQITFGTSEGDGSGQTIAIVAAYADSSLSDSSSSTFKSSDLALFDQEFDQADPSSFTILNQYGTDIGTGSYTGPTPPKDPTGAGEDTEALDVEWVHSIAPGASIVLLECNSSSADDMFAGLTTAENLAGVSVVMMNQTSGQAPGQSEVDAAFTTPSGHQGVTFVAPTGDSGSPGWSPAYSSNVVAVGGTTLTLNPLDIDAPYVSEVGWSNSGGGTSTVETEPAYQDDFQTTGYRTIPDVSFDADPNTGVAVYDSYNYGSTTPWVQVGGTSLAASCWAGLIAIADQGRVAAGATTLDGPSQTLPALYSLPDTDFHDGLGGSNGTNDDGLLDPASYDEVTGLGSPQANVLVSDLASYQWGSQLVVTAQPPLSATAGDSFGFAVTAEDRFGNVETSFNGTVTVALASGPAGGNLGGTLTATAVDGMATFTGPTLDTAGDYTFQATCGDLTSNTTSTLTVTPAPAAQLAVTAQPPTSISAGGTFGLTVSVEDIYGNVEPSFAGSVSIALFGSTVTLNGTLVDDNEAMASFPTLSLDIAGDYTFQASSGGGLISPPTSVLTVTPGPAAQLVLTPPTSVIAGNSFGVTVSVDDAFGNVETTFGSSVSMKLALGSAGGTLNGNLTATAANGVASFTGLSLDIVGTYMFLAILDSLPSQTTNDLTVTPAAASKLVIYVEPSPTATAGQAFGTQPVIYEEDQYGNLETNDNSTVVTASLTSGAGLLQGTTATVSGGVATFTTLAELTAETITLIFTEGALTSSPTSTLTVAPAAVTQLAVTAQPPASVIAGGNFGLTVSAEDIYGNVEPSFPDVTVALFGSTVPLDGTVTRQASNPDVAEFTFTGLTVDTIGSYTLQAIGGGLFSPPTSVLTVTPGPAAQLAVIYPTSIIAGDAFGLTVSDEDAFGNVEATFGSSVTIALATAPAGAALGGTTTVAASNGVAAFTGLTLDTSGNGYTFQVSGDGLTATTTVALTVTPAPATQLAVVSQPLSSVVAGATFGLTLWAEDAFGDRVTSFGSSVSIALATGGGNLGGTLTVTAVDGAATFLGLSLDTAAAGYTFQATSSGLTSITTTALTVTPAPATQLVVTAQPPISVIAGDSFGLTVSDEDAFGNVETSFNGSATVAFATAPSGAALGGATTVASSNGVAAFAGLAIDTVGTYSFQVSCGDLTSTPLNALSVTPVPDTQPVGYTPLQIRAAYGINQVMFGTIQGNGSGQTIAIVDAYDDPALLDSTSSSFKFSDLALFDQNFNQPDPPSFTLLNQYGTDIGTGSYAGPTPATDPTGVWEETEAVDVEWVHSISPGASIVLVECNSDSAADMLTGVTTAKSLAGVSVVMMNQTSGQAPSLSLVDDDFTTSSGHQGVTFVAPTGDSGSPGWSPAYSSNVVTVGGTTLTLNPLDVAAPYVSEVGWSNSGGGISNVETEPAYQQSVQTTGYRTIPDVSFDADPSTGVAVYDSYNNGSTTPWVQVGGTSLAASCWAGLIAIADQGRVAAGATTLDGPSQTLPALYSLPAADFHDDLGGDNGTNDDGLLDPANYNEVTGLGTPQANDLVSDLASYQWGSQLVVTAQPPSSVTAGNPFGFTVTVEDHFGDVETSFDGNVTVAFGDNPGGGPLRGTLIATATNGVAVFSGLSITTADSGYTLQATGVGVTAAITTFINVTPGPATELAVTTQPPGAVAIDSIFGLTIAAEDAFGNLATTFNGSVSEGLANNPGDGALGGMTTVTAVQGVATFANLTINVASTDYTLQATSSGLASTTTGALDVTPASTQLVATTEPPAGVIAGGSFGLEVSVEDAFGEVVPNFDGNVTVALASDAPGGNLGGTLTVTAVNGEATFTGLSLNTAGGYTLVVSSGLLTDATTDILSVAPGPVAQLVVTTPPPLTTTAGTSFGLTVSAEDTYGNVETSFFGNMTVALVGSTVALSGTLTTTASQGVASFTGLVLDTAGTSYTLQASSGGLTTTTSALSVTPAPATLLVVTRPPPATMTAGSSFGLTVSAEDAFGNLATTFNGSVTVALATAAGGSALSGTTTVTAIQGVAAFSGLALDAAGDGFTIHVDSGVLNATIQGVNVTPGPATELAVTTQPPATITAGSSFGLTISVEDAFGNLATTFSGSVTVALATDPGRGVLSGTTTVTAVQGVAEFNGLVLDTAGTDYTLQATGQGLSSTTTNALDVIPGSAAQLVVTTSPPGTLAASSTFGTTVWAEDAFGNLATSFDGSVTVALITGPGDGALSGTTTVAATKGVAEFTSLALDTAGTGYRLQATSSGLTSATTGTLGVTAAATQLVVTSQPPASVAAGTGFGLTVSVEDAAGNLVTTFNDDVTIALANNPGGANLGGTLTVTAVNGVATFAGLAINAAGTNYTLRATSNGLTDSTTAPVTVTAGAVPHLAIFVEAGPVLVGNDFEVTVDVENSQGVTETNFPGSVTLTLAGNPTGATLGGNLTLPVIDGQVTFYGLTLNAASSGYSIRASSNGFVDATTPPITMVNPPATQLVVTGQPPASVAANGEFGLTIAVVDASGNLVSSFDGNVTVALAGKPGGGKLHGTLTVTATNGVATFSGLTLTKARHGYTLRVTASGLILASTEAFNVSPVAARRLSSSPHPHPSKAKRT